MGDQGRDSRGDDAGKEQASSAIWVAVSQIELPEKKYFKIGEVAHLVGVEPHVLRYWQTQFTQVRPHKSRSGHRLYRRKDVETLLAIKELLHVQRFTIAGARQALRNAVVHRGDTSVPPIEASALATPAPVREPALGPAHPDVAVALQPERPEAQPASAPAAEAVSPPAAGQQIELVGLDGDALKHAMDRELALRTPSAIARLDLEAETVVPGLEDGTAEAPSLGAGAAAASVTLQASAPEVEKAGVAQLPFGTATEPAPAAEAPAHPSPTEGRDLEGPIAFAGVAGEREGLEQARRDLVALLDFLDIDEDAQRRRKLWPGIDAR